MMWLVKLADSWADEIDIEGFSIMSTSQFNQWAKTVEEVAKKTTTRKKKTETEATEKKPTTRKKAVKTETAEA